MRGNENRRGTGCALRKGQGQVSGGCMASVTLFGFRMWASDEDGKVGVYSKSQLSWKGSGGEGK